MGEGRRTHCNILQALRSDRLGPKAPSPIRPERRRTGLIERISLTDVKLLLGSLKCVLAVHRFPKCRMFGPRSVDQPSVPPLQTINDLAPGIHHRRARFLLGRAEKSLALLGTNFSMARFGLVALHIIVMPIDFLVITVELTAFAMKLVLNRFDA